MSKRTFQTYLKKYIKLGHEGGRGPLFDQFFDRFQSAGPLPEDWSDNKRHALKRDMWSQIERGVFKTQPPTRRGRSWLFYGSIAASVLLFAALGALILGQKTPPSTERKGLVLRQSSILEVAPGEAVRAFHFPDGSKVWLNSSSRIEVPAEFGDSLRIVRLEGEAFFEIRRDTLLPFVVMTDDIFTQVLGTSFNISAYEKEDLRVSVSSGRVSVFEENGKEEILNSGQGIRISNQGSNWSRERVDTAKIEAWRKGVIHFDNSRLEDVLRQFERRFGYKFVITDNHTGDCVLNGELSTRNITGFLLSLNSLYGIDYQSDSTQKTIYIRNGNCTY
ncbi:MAG: FecR domain-containing protein [Bacteroidota bacterium]